MSSQAVFGKNQQTISFLRAQDFFRAAESASAALGLHHSYAASNEQDPRYTSGLNALDQCMLMSKEVSQECDDDVTPLTFVYSEGIVIPPGTMDTELLTAILIFNAALAHHLLAMHVKNNEASFRCFHKAKRLYVLAYRLQDANHHNLLFQFAVINNVAMIDQTLGNVETALASLEYIISTIMLLLDRGHHGSFLPHACVFLANVPFTINAAGAA